MCCFHDGLFSVVVAPVAAWLGERFSQRVVVLGGGICCFLGMFLAAFATNVYHVCAAFGLLSGQCNSLFAGIVHPLTLHVIRLLTVFKGVCCCQFLALHHFWSDFFSKFSTALIIFSPRLITTKHQFFKDRVWRWPLVYTLCWLFVDRYNYLSVDNL